MRTSTTLTGVLFLAWAFLAAAPALAELPGLANLPRRGLIAYWPGDGDARDAAGKSHGTLQNKVKFAPGVFGQAFQCDGNGSHVEVPADIFGNRKAFTFSCWLKSNGGGHFLTQSADCPNEAPAYKHRVLATNLIESGQIHVLVAGPRTVWVGHHNKLGSTGRLQHGKWHHVAVVFDAGELALYVDGRQDAAKTIYCDYSSSPGREVDKTLFQTTGPTAEPMRIGTKYSYDGRTAHLVLPSFRGVIDELAVWDRALSAEEIAGIAASTEAGGSTLGDGLAAYWPADGDANDAVGKSHGKMMNGATFGPGRSGKAFKLDGEDDYIHFGNEKALLTTEGRTIAMWVCPDRVDKWRELISLETLGEGRIAVTQQGALCYGCGRRGPDGSERIYLYTDGFVQHYRDEARTEWHVQECKKRFLAAGRWTHVAVVQSPKPGRVRWYVQGDLVCEVSVPFDMVSASDGALLIGRIVDAPGKEPGFSGLIDDVVIWKRALDGEEVRQLFEATSLGEALRGGGTAPPYVERLAATDRVALADGQTLTGTVENETLAIASAFGELKLAVKDLAGLARGKDANGLWVLLNDGQAIRGTTCEKALRLRLSTGSVLTIPLADVRQCGWRAVATDPNAPAPDLRRLGLSDGQRLNWTSVRETLRLRTAYGLVDLPGERLVRIMASRAGAYRVQFANGATLAGTLLPEKLTFKLALGPDLAVDGRSLRSLTMPAEPEDAGAQAVLTTRDGDSLIGLVADERLTVRTPYGDAPLPPGSLPSLTFDANDPNKTVAKQWDGMVLRGTLAEKEIAFVIGRDGPVLKVPTARVASITRAVALPPPEVVKRVEKLIAQLGAESHRDRDAAQKELESMGGGIVPFLKPHLQSADIEVRQRVEAILEKLGAKP